MENVEEKIIERLLKLGLTKNEAKAYVALLELEVASPLEIAEYAEIPISRVYFVLSSLSKKGFVESQRGRPKLYRAISPRIALRLLKEKYIKTQEEVLNLINGLKFRNRMIETKTFWIIKGRKNIIERVRSLIASSSVELMIATKDRTIIVDLARYIQNAVKRRVNVYLVAYKSSEEITGRIIEMFKKSTALRIRDILAPSVFIYDNKIGLVYTETPRRSYKTDTALLIENEEFLPIYKSYYQLQIWYSSKPAMSYADYFSSPRTYLAFFRAVEDAEYLLSKNIPVRVLAEGWLLNEKKKRKTLGGKVISVYKSSDHSVYNITIETDNGERYVLGGRGCVIESFETEKITLIPLKKLKELNS
ncbi:MAG: hypothetical protein J7J67_01460 [Thermoproteales archaeon]|nr:hypothetical protein [Thermoproteales archaeon]